MFRLVKLSLLLLVASIPSSFQASPAAGAKSLDRLLGHNKSSYFIERTISIQPDTYFESKQLVEIIEISFSSGSIINRCTTRLTSYAAPDSFVEKGWEASEAETDPVCNAQNILRNAEADHIKQELQVPGLEGNERPVAVWLDKTGLRQRLRRAEDLETRTLVDAEYMTSRFLGGYAYRFSTTQGEDFERSVDLLSECRATYEGYQSGTLRGEVDRQAWIFVGIVCRRDFDTRFYLPVDRALFW